MPIEGLVGFGGPHYPVKRSVCEDAFFSSLKPGKKLNGGSVEFKGLGTAVVKTFSGRPYPLSARFKTQHDGEIWVLWPGEKRPADFPPFLTRGCASGEDMVHVADELKRHLDNTAARSRRAGRKKKHKKKG